MQEDLYGQGPHFADALAHARDGRIEVVEVGVVVERDDRDVVGNPEFRLLDCLDRPQQDGVAHGEDRRGACRSAQRELRFEIPVLDREVVARDAGAILQSRLAQCVEIAPLAFACGHRVGYSPDT